MEWLNLNTIDQLEEIQKKSYSKKQAIFKHSTRCGISSMVKNRLERAYDIPSSVLDIYYLDLIANREISNQIQKNWGVVHESPQLILIENGEVILHDSHTAISVENLKKSF